MPENTKLNSPTSEDLEKNWSDKDNWLMTKPANELELIEHLAHFEHESWSHWMRYLFSKCIVTSNNSLVIPAELVKRWQLQAETEYKDLSEEEKESDRIEVRKIISVIKLFAGVE